jgi:hypothetical protein
MRERRGVCTLTTSPLLMMPLASIPSVLPPPESEIHMCHRLAASVSERHNAPASNYGSASSHTASDMPLSGSVIRPRIATVTPKITECQQRSGNTTSNWRR